MDGRALALLAGLAAMGCLPIPHVEHDAPALSGTLTQNGTPVEGARVRVATTGLGTPSCASADHEARTDRAGRFALDRVSHFVPVLVGEEGFTTWALCFDLPDGTSAIWVEEGRFGGPPQQVLTCEVNGASGPGPIRLADDSVRARRLSSELRDLAKSHQELSPKRLPDPSTASHVCHVRDLQRRRRRPLPAVRDRFP